jgi:spore maturation protein SpmB
MITAQTWKQGSINGLKTWVMLMKIILPIYVCVALLGRTPAIAWVSKLFAPVMGLTGLPGEAAIAFITGALISMYAAIGIIIALPLTPWQLTTLALMLNLCHELFVETAVLKKIGIVVWPVVLIRIGGALLVGGLMNLAGQFLG